MVASTVPEARASPCLRHDVGVRLSRRWALFLVLVGAFQWLVWPTFLHNIWADDRSFGPGPGGGPTAFLVVHAVLTGAQLLLASVLLWLGFRALRTSPKNP